MSVGEIREMSSALVKPSSAEVFAASVGARLAEYTGGKMAGREASQLYKRIPTTLDELEALVRQTIAADAASARSFWTEIRSFFKNPFTYRARKRAFDTAVQMTVSHAERVMQQVRLLCRPALENMDKPEELERVALRWNDVNRRTAVAVGPVPALREIEGWSGMAYNDYRKMAQVQMEACREFEPFSYALSEGYRFAAKLNKSVLTTVYHLLDNVQRFERRQPGSMEFYVHTIALTNALMHCARRLPEAMNMTQEAALELAGRIEESKAQTVLLDADRWPKGWAQFGLGAGNTRAESLDVSNILRDVDTSVRTDHVQGLRR